MSVVLGFTPASCLVGKHYKIVLQKDFPHRFKEVTVTRIAVMIMKFDMDYTVKSF